MLYCSQPMKPSFVAVFLMLSTVLTPVVASAASTSSTEGSRYLLQSTKGFWKSTFGARNEFADGFTADLSDLQLRLAKFAGLKPIAVKKYSILPADVVVQERAVPTAQVPWGVVRITGADTVPAGGASVSIAVLDTGVAVAHPDLARRIRGCKDFTQPKVSVVDNTCVDDNGHGTHIAGIIAADGGKDGKGIYGVAPEATVLAYKVCADSGSCWSDDIAVAIRSAVDAGAQIITLSLGSDSASSLIADAITYATDKGALVVAAAGNDGPYSDSIDFPAALAKTVSVAAIDADGAIPDWSSRGINETTKTWSMQDGDVELVAPGVNIESTFKDGGYAILSGTSMAAPHVAGLAAVLWQKHAESPADATRTLLHELAHDIAPIGDDDASGWGLPVQK